MPDIKQLRVRTAVDLSGLDRGLVEFNSKIDKAVAKTQADYGKLTEAGQRIGTGLSIGVTAPIVLMGTQAIRAAMDASSSEVKFGIAFKGMSDSARRWSEDFGKSVGVCDFELRDMASDFQLLFNAMDISRAKGLQMSEGLTQLATDLAALHGIPVAEAFERLQGGMVGMVRSVRAFGMNVSQAAMQQEALKQGLGDDVTALTEAQQAMLRYSLMMGQAADAHGFLASHMDTATARTIRLKSEIGGLAIKFGDNLLPAYKEVLSVGMGVVGIFNGMGDSARRNLLYFAGGAALLGPMTLGFINLTRGYHQYHAILELTTLARAAATTAEEIATATQIGNAAALGVDTLGIAANAAAKKYATLISLGFSTTVAAEQAAVAAEAAALEAETLAVGASTTGWLANAAARLAAITVSPVGVVAAGVITAGAVVATEATVYKNRYRAGFAGEREGGKDFDRMMSNFERTYSKHDTSHLERDLELQKAEAARVGKKMDDLDAAWWRNWLPLNTQARAEWERDQGSAKAKVDWLTKRLEASKTETEATKQLTEEQQKALAENDKANLYARRDIWVSRQNDDPSGLTAERESAQAWVDYSKAKDDILANQKKVLEKDKITLDVTDQLAGAMAAYKVKMAKIHKESSAALNTQNLVEWTAAANVVASANTNEFTRRWLEVEIQHTTALRALAVEKAKGAYVTERIKEANTAQAKAQREIAKDYRLNQISDFTASTEAKAIAAGDTFGARKTELIGGAWTAMAQLADKGDLAKGARAKIVASLNRDIVALKKEQTDTLTQASRDSWKNMMGALKGSTESYYSNMGNEYGGKNAALDIGFKTQMQEIDWQREELKKKLAVTAKLKAAATTPDERGMVQLGEQANKLADAAIAARSYEITQAHIKAQRDLSKERQKQTDEELSASYRLRAGLEGADDSQIWAAQWDAFDKYQTGVRGLNDLKEKGIDITQRQALLNSQYNAEWFKPIKDNLVKAWQDRKESAKEYYEFVKHQTGLSTYERNYELAGEQGAASAIPPMPFIGPSPAEATQNQLEAVWEKIVTKAETQRGGNQDWGPIMERVAIALERVLTRSYQ